MSGSDLGLAKYISAYFQLSERSRGQLKILAVRFSKLHPHKAYPQV